jgi:hypothetical protein
MVGSVVTLVLAPGLEVPALVTTLCEEPMRTQTLADGTVAVAPAHWKDDQSVFACYCSPHDIDLTPMGRAIVFARNVPSQAQAKRNEQGEPVAPYWRER